MQAMPDKDFDKLFQERFETFEVEPSSSVWRGIEAELEKKGTKRSFPVFWLNVAASTLIVVSAGLWLFSPKEKIRLHGKPVSLVIQDETPVNAATENPVVREKVRKVKRTRSVPPSTFGLAVASPVKPVETEHKQAIQEAHRPGEAPAMKQAGVAKVENVKIESPKTENTVPKEVKAPVAEEQPVLALANDSYASAPKRETEQQRRIKTVGDLVNLIVGKVDPREDKIIQFKNDEEGGSEVSGINLGLVKFKSRNNR